MSVEQLTPDGSLQPMQWHELSWTPNPGVPGWPKDVKQLPVRFISNSADPDTLVLNGLGGETKDLEDTIQYLGEHGLTAAGVELVYLKEAVQALTNEVLQSSMATVAHELNRSSGHARRRNLIGPSKGAAETLLTAGLALRDPKRRELYGSIGALNTIGVANKALGQNLGDPVLEAKARRREFVERMTQNAEFEPAITQLSRGDTMRVRSTLMYDGVPVVIGLAKAGVRVKMFSGTLDCVAPTQELEAELGKYAHLIERIPGHHASLSTEVGKKQILRVAQWAVSRDKISVRTLTLAKRLRFRAYTAIQENW